MKRVSARTARRAVVVLISAAWLAGAVGGASADEGRSVGQVLAQYGNDTCGSCAAVRPLISQNPQRAAQLIVTADAREPIHRDGLAYCLGSIYRGMRGPKPDGARQIMALVASASPAFRAAFASVVAPDAPAPELCTRSANAGGSLKDGPGHGPVDDVDPAYPASSSVGAPVGPGTGGFGTPFGTFGGTGGGVVVSPTRP